MKGTVTGAILAFVTATINLVAVFGWTFTPGQRDAIIAEAVAVIAIAPIVGAVFDHSRKQAEARLTAAAQIASKP